MRSRAVRIPDLSNRGILRTLAHRRTGSLCSCFFFFICFFLFSCHVTQRRYTRGGRGHGHGHEAHKKEGRLSASDFIFEQERARKESPARHNPCHSNSTTTIMKSLYSSRGDVFFNLIDAALRLSSIPIIQIVSFVQLVCVEHPACSIDVIAEGIPTRRHREGNGALRNSHQVPPPGPPNL